ncbi:MAG: hypothetical protein QW404_02165 [Candidatus Nanoarchaeia archaeon]
MKIKNELAKVRETRNSLTSQEISYLRYIRLKQMRKEHWLNQKIKIVG